MHLRQLFLSFAKVCGSLQQLLDNSHLGCGVWGSVEQGRKIRKNSPSLVSTVGGAQEGCPATGTLGRLKSLHTQAHSLAKVAHNPLPGAPDTQLYRRELWDLQGDITSASESPGVLCFPSQHRIVTNPMQLIQSQTGFWNSHIYRLCQVSEPNTLVHDQLLQVYKQILLTSLFSLPLYPSSIYSDPTFPKNVPENSTSPQHKYSST